MFEFFTSRKKIIEREGARLEGSTRPARWTMAQYTLFHSKPLLIRVFYLERYEYKRWWQKPFCKYFYTRKVNDLRYLKPIPKKSPANEGTKIEKA